MTSKQKHEPDYAYVPGQNDRHPEGAFDHIRDTAKKSMSPAQLAECDAFTCGLYYIDNGFYWEAHEVLEAVWMELPQESHERSFVQGLIQYANACLKVNMERPNAALRLCVIARELIPTEHNDIIMNVDCSNILGRIEKLEGKIMQNNA